MRTIVVVDGSPVVRAVVRRCLEPWACRIAAAATLEGVAVGDGPVPALGILEVGSSDGWAAALAARGWAAMPVVELVRSGPHPTPPPARTPATVAQLGTPFNAGQWDAAVRPVLGAPQAFFVGTEGACAVVGVHTLDAPALSAIDAAMRRLVAHGCRQVILDVGREIVANAEQVARLVTVVQAARTAGLHPAVCAADARVRAELNAHADTRDTPCGTTRGGARESLQQTGRENDGAR